jgi:SNF2 family DNA or RNA helicase/predicted RNA methylase
MKKNKITASNLAALAASPDAANKGTQQYTTPPDWAEAIAIPLTYCRPCITDLHCADGSLPLAAANDTTKFILGHDIDTNAKIKPHPDHKIARTVIHNDIINTFHHLLSTNTQFDLLTLNPPFSLRWPIDKLPTLKKPGEKSTHIKSTLATIRMATQLLSDRGEGYIIANTDTIARLEKSNPTDFKHVWLSVTTPSFYPGVSKELSITILYFAKQHINSNIPFPHEDLAIADLDYFTNKLCLFRKTYRKKSMGINDDYNAQHNFTNKQWLAIKQEVDTTHKRRAARPNITLNPDGTINAYLTSYQKIDTKITKKDANALIGISGTHPFTLIVQKSTRSALQGIISSGVWTISPNANKAISAAISQYHQGRTSLSPLNPIQQLGWIDEQDKIICTTVLGIGDFTAGESYKITTQVIESVKEETRPCITNGKRSKEKVRTTSSNLQILINQSDEKAQPVSFQQFPDEDNPHSKSLQDLADHFETPTVPHVSQQYPELHAEHTAKLHTMLINGEKFKPFQIEDLATAGCVDGLIYSQQQGLGKSLAAFAYPMLKGAKRTLIVAPGGLHDQFRETAARFYGKALPVIKTKEDLIKWKFHLPPTSNSPQFFLITYEALTRNNADEWEPKKDKDDKFIYTKSDHKRIITYGTWAKHTAIERLTGKKFEPSEIWASIGTEKNGITCVWEPSIASMLAIYESKELKAGADCIALDEATRLQSSVSLMACGIRKLNPTYRILLTGTPIKNNIESLFHLLHWAAGGHKLPTIKFPFYPTSEDKEKFANLHLESDQYVTREKNKKLAQKIAGDKVTNTKIIKRSSRICNVHHLWKLIAPIIIRRRKDQCGESIVEKTIRPILAMPGHAQLAVYGHHLKHPPIKSKAGTILKGRCIKGVQINNLRQITLSPSNPELKEIQNGQHSKTKLSWTPWTPKLAATITLIQNLIQQGEQVIIGSPFSYFNHTLHDLLNQAGVKSMLLDGTTSPAKRGALIADFKNKTVPILIAGIKAMGEGHSLECCSNLILPSLSWAFDENDQFVERVWRLNSKKPVTIYPIVTKGTIDELLASTYADKKDSASLALDGKLFDEQIDDIDPDILLADAYDQYKTNPESTPEESLEHGWTKQAKQLKIAQRLYDEFHPPITNYQVTQQDIINAKANLQTNDKQQNFAISNARKKQALLLKIKKSKR